MKYDTKYNDREIEYIDHNYSSDTSSLSVRPRYLTVGEAKGECLGAHRWCNKPPPLAQTMLCRFY